MRTIQAVEVLTVLCDDLNQQRSLFKNVFKLINDVQKEHKNNCTQLFEKGVSAIKLYDEVSSRQKKILDDLNKESHKERLIFFFIRSIFNL